MGRFLDLANRADAAESETSVPATYLAVQGAQARQQLTEKALAKLNETGVRLMRLDGLSTIGVWSDLDGRDIRAALRVLELDRLPLRYLDGDGIPMRYKLRKVAGEPVPMSVLEQMERGSSPQLPLRPPLNKPGPMREAEGPPMKGVKGVNRVQATRSK